MGLENTISEGIISGYRKSVGDVDKDLYPDNCKPSPGKAAAVPRLTQKASLSVSADLAFAVETEP